MQTRPYPDQEGRRVWLSRSEQDTLLDIYRDEDPRRELALQLGLHGLRSDEIVNVAAEHFRQLDEDGFYKLKVPQGKSGARECPVRADVRQTATILANAAGKNKDEPLIDVTTKALRDWIADAREDVFHEIGEESWLHVGMHDLRRTWATDTFYSLAFGGVPIAEELTMGWGGWKMTASGRETFRENYLGPEPDHIAARAMDTLPLTN